VFDTLTERLSSVFSRLRGKGKLSEADVSEGLREIRIALLEADVHYKVVKDLIERIRERAVGEEVLGSLTPGQQIVKIVRDELTTTMGGDRTGLHLDRKPAVVLLVGLQGSGKTTSAAKLASLLKREGRKPVLVAADVYRPAAIDQLERLGRDLEIPVVSRVDPDPVKIASAGVAWAKSQLRDVVLIDTAGRLQIDDEMMREIEAIAMAVPPDDVLLVADAMTGQEAVSVANAFNERVALSGVVLTKTDGDARGGAALSIRHATGRPILYVGTGEKVEGLEAFHPQRMADRILGMGDVMTLIEKAEATIDATKAEELVQRIRKNRFTLQDFLEQLEEMRKLGPLSQIVERLPGAGRLKGLRNEVDESELKRTLAILRSMTLEERTNPSIIGGSRKKRIARGSGTRVRDVNGVLSRYEDAKRALKMVGGRKGKGRFPEDLLGTS
jgi:signal recognition particle subunit SRP54